MLWSEFMNGTGCKDNDYNYVVYSRLDAMYMYTDMNKGEIYEYGKKLVDNSLSDDELQLRDEILLRIEEIDLEISDCSERIRYLKNELSYEEDSDRKKILRDSIRNWAGIKKYALQQKRAIQESFEDFLKKGD